MRKILLKSSIRSILIVFFVIVSVLFVERQSQFTDADILIQKFVTNGEALVLKNWSVSIDACRQEGTLEVCSPLTEKSLVLGFPFDAKKGQIDFSESNPNDYFRMIATYKLTDVQLSWVENREQIALSLPNILNDRTELLSSDTGFSRQRLYQNKDIDVSFFLEKRALLESRQIRLDLTSSKAKFGPLTTPIMLVEWSALASVQKIPEQVSVADELARQVRFGLPAVLGMIAFLLDHSKSLGYLAGFAILAVLPEFFEKGFMSEDGNAYQYLLWLLIFVCYQLFYRFVYATLVLKVLRTEQILFAGVAAFTMVLMHLIRAENLDIALGLGVYGSSVLLALFGILSQRNTSAFKKNRSLSFSRLGFLAILLLAFCAYLEKSQYVGIGIANLGLLDALHFLVVPSFILFSLFETGSVIKSLDRVSRKVREKAKVERDLKVSRELQKQLLPRKKNFVRGWHWRTFYYPCSTLAGDWLDIREHRFTDGKSSIIGLVCDVTGHGIASSLLVGALSSKWNVWLSKIAQLPMPGSEAEKNQLLEDAARDLNRTMFDISYNRGASLGLFFLDLDKRSSSVTYLNAGHPGVVLIEGQRLRFLSSRGELIGVNPELNCTEAYTEKLGCESEVKILIYSDGLIPPSSSQSGWLGSLAKELRQGGNLGHLVLNQVRANKRYFREHEEYEDDITAIILKTKGS